MGLVPKLETITMRIITTLLSLALLAGCASEGQFIANSIPNTCDGKGHTFVFINYGDGYLSAKAVIKVKPGKELQYRLKPGSKSDVVTFRDMRVTISGKDSPVPPFPAPPSDDAWLDATGIYSAGDRVLKVCVPENPVGDKYYYTITVENVGQLDPRADIEK